MHFESREGTAANVDELMHLLVLQAAVQLFEFLISGRRAYFYLVKRLKESGKKKREWSCRHRQTYANSIIEFERIQCSFTST